MEIKINNYNLEIEGMFENQILAKIKFEDERQNNETSHQEISLLQKPLKSYYRDLMSQIWAPIMFEIKDKGIIISEGGYNYFLIRDIKTYEIK